MGCLVVFKKFSLYNSVINLFKSRNLVVAVDLRKLTCGETAIIFFELFLHFCLRQ